VNFIVFNVSNETSFYESFQQPSKWFRTEGNLEVLDQDKEVSRLGVGVQGEG